MRMLAVMLCCLISITPVMPAFANDIVINIPPPPKNFPKKFPKYKKCMVNGVRRACYGKKGIQELQAVWDRYQVLVPVLPVVKQQQSMLQTQGKALKAKTKEARELRAANKKKTKANEALRRQLKVEEKHRRWQRTKNILIGVGTSIGAIGIGIVIVFVIAKTT